ncbi:hypothetical protein [Neolewinella persica]|uniref:hypothetical protein n=1 Tax=Neolewinella persica TaxID=70998 RepID=UPI00039A3DCC|nr:hypothetical protein [Neolewinella persica]
MPIKRKVILASMVILGLISIGAYLADQPSSQPNAHSGMGYLMLMALGVGLEAFLLLVAGLVSYFRKGAVGTGLIKASEVPEHKQWGNAFFLAIGLVLLIGSSICIGGGTIFYG